MTIKFSDEAIQKASNAWMMARLGSGWRAAAAVFEAEAQRQVDLDKQIAVEIAASSPLARALTPDDIRRWREASKNGRLCPSSAIATEPTDTSQSAEGYWKARAERAEAKLEALRGFVEVELITHADVQVYDSDYETALRKVADRVGLTINPARELTVTWEGGK